MEAWQEEYIQEQHKKLDQYVQDVLDGTIITNKRILQAVHRYVRDRASDKYDFRIDKLDKFFYFLTYIKINQDDKYVWFHPEPWQVFYLSSLFAFYHKGTDRRRFTTSFLCISRKNGKTTIAMLIALYGLTQDGVQDAQVYIVSATNKLANSGFDIAKNIVQHSPALKKRLRNMQYSIRYQTKETSNFLKAATGDPDSLNSIRPAVLIYDESHLYQTSDLIDMGKSGQVGVTNPQCHIITTRGNNTQGWFQYEYEKYLGKVLDQETTDESTFIMMFGLDTEEEVNQPEMWVKANPNLTNPKILTLDQLTDLYEQKRYRLSGLKNFLTFNLNWWYESSEDGFIPADVLDKVFVDEIPEAIIESEEAFLGLDLSDTRDLCALSLIFPPSFNHPEFIIKNWNIKTNVVENRIRPTGIDISGWIASGEIIELEKERIDYEFLFKLIDELSDKYYIKKVGYDRYNSALLIPKVRDELALEIQDIPQRAMFLNMPMKFIENLVYEQNVIIDNGCTKWQFANVQLIEDSNANIRPAKNKSKDSIDSVIAICNAMACYLESIGQVTFSY